MYACCGYYHIAHNPALFWHIYNEAASTGLAETQTIGSAADHPAESRASTKPIIVTARQG